MEGRESAREVARVRICTSVQQVADDVFPGVLGGVVERRHLVGVRRPDVDSVAKRLPHCFQVSPGGSGEELLLVRSQRPAKRRTARLASQQKVSARVQSHRFSHAGPDALVATQ